MIKLAIQKSGRLSEESIALIQKTGISFSSTTGKMTQLKADAKNFPLTLLYLRDDDIPGYVADGVADIGIVGENEVFEKQKKITTVIKLGFANCRLSLAIPRAEEYHGIAGLAGKRIATSYPVILSNYLKENKIKAEVHEISGSVEIAPSIGLSHAICDLVSSGSTLLSNGLKEVETILTSQAVLIKTATLNPEKQALVNQLLFRIKSVQTGENYKYILLNAPLKSIDKIIAILPGMRSPTVLPLAQKNWYSVHSVVPEENFWACIEQLKKAGAEGILSSSIENMVL